MGMPKAALPFGPEVMLERVTRLLGLVVEPIVIVAARDQQLPELPPDVIIARDQQEGRGPLEGLLAGLQAIRPYVDAAYATSCDVPLLAGSFVERLIAMLRDHDIVVPRGERFHHPLAAVYRLTVLPHIQSLLEADQRRPVFLFDRTDTREVPVEQLREVDPELDTLRNLNEPRDYFAALAKAGFEAPAEVAARLNQNPDGSSA